MGIPSFMRSAFEGCTTENVKPTKSVEIKKAEPVSIIVPTVTEEVRADKIVTDETTKKEEAEKSSILERAIKGAKERAQKARKEKKPSVKKPNKTKK